MKSIIFCADGTWNSPGQDEDKDGVPDPTNVFKLFVSLAGTPVAGSMLLANEQESEFHEGGAAVQVAKYIHGVGDAGNPIGKLIGGAFGAGLISRIVRGYTYISRKYQPGDNIVIIGFSRGAYTARALAGLIANKGLLRNVDERKKEDAYRRGAQAWYQYRSESLTKADKRDLLTRFAEAMADLPGFLTQNTLKKDDFVQLRDPIGAVAVWDTVGAMGIPLYHSDARSDTFKFFNNDLSSKVKVGLHAIALDEQRVDFTPTFWEPRDGVLQMVFPGAHADVGGGYAESGLSDIALQWMMDELNAQAGVLFQNPGPLAFKPNPAGDAHEPWKLDPWKNLGPRVAVREMLKRLQLQAHPSIEQRSKQASVRSNPSGAAIYKPGNWPF
jgi:uncharacterized protein (DUF2235 family)